MFFLVLILCTAHTPPSNNLYLTLDIAIDPPNPISAHPITLVNNDLRSTLFSCDEEEGLFSDLVECTEILRCVDDGDGGLNTY